MAAGDLIHERIHLRVPGTTVIVSEARWKIPPAVGISWIGTSPIVRESSRRWTRGASPRWIVTFFCAQSIPVGVEAGPSEIGQMRGRVRVRADGASRHVSGAERRI